MAGVKGRSGRRRIKTVDPTPEDGLPRKPAWLSKNQSKYWSMLLKQIQTDWLRQADLHLLASLAVLLDRQETLTKRLAEDPCDDTGQRLLVGTVDRIAKLSALFGLAPADRKRFGVEEEPEREETPDAIEEWHLENPLR